MDCRSFNNLDPILLDLAWIPVFSPGLEPSLATSMVPKVELSNFVWSPAEVCLFIMNKSVAQLMDDYEEEQIVTR